MTRYLSCIAAGMVLGVLVLALGAAAAIEFVDYG